MKIENWYSNNYESSLHGRYINLQHIIPLLDNYKKYYDIKIAGYSEEGHEIPLIKIGNGPKTVLGWSQMHGNESTTTKALFDFLKFTVQKGIFQPEIDVFLRTYSFYLIPMLNPDGASRYSRENSNNVDLNRDAKNLSQWESKCLRDVFNKINPSLCLNFHDQRSIYGFETGKPAVVSFLSPAADADRTITQARKVAMQKIVKMDAALQKYIPAQVGRYDDSFNEACVGDTFQKMGVPTILFEAGHYRADYQREKTREFIFYSLLALFNINGKKEEFDYAEYFKIPENIKNFNDIIFRNVKIDSRNSEDISIQFNETLYNKNIHFEPIIRNINKDETKFGYKEYKFTPSEVLTKIKKNLTCNTNISEIIDKIDNYIISFQRNKG